MNDYFYQEDKMVGGLVYGDSFDGDYDKSRRKASENVAMKKSSNDVNYRSLNAYKVTPRKENPYSQTEFGYQDLVNTTPDRYHNVSATSW